MPIIFVNGTRIDVEGDLNNVSVRGGVVSVNGDVAGPVDAGGSVRCGKVGGDVDAGGSVRHS